jgi:methanogenic corrinoid protein MtbC1
VTASPELRGAIRAALETYDREGAVKVATRALADGSTSIPTLYRHLSDIQAEVGAEWQSGEVEVWQEHFMSGVVRSIVEACAPEVERAAPAERTATIVLAAPTDEYHDLGLRMLADRFSLAGWQVLYLGANLPVSEILSAVEELGANAVGLSASTHFHRATLKGYVTALSESHPHVRVWVGGPAFAHEHDDWSDDVVLDQTAIPAAGSV